jgi:hypothetical protein
LSGFDSAATKVFNDTLVSLLGDIADVKTNLAVTYAEAAKTSDMILSTAKRFERAYRAFRKGNFKAVARELNLRSGTVHKTWLEYKYGWTPLLMEVKGSAEFFAQQTLGGRPPRFVVQKKGKFPKPLGSGNKLTYAPAYGGTGSGSYEWKLQCDYRCRQKLWCEVVNPHFNRLQQLGLTNPALVAWESVPYSFVFDWFVSVGDWLTGLTALHGVSIRKSFRSNINSFHYEYAQDSTSYTVGSYYYFNGSRQFTVDKRHYARGVLTVDPYSLSIPTQIPNSFQKLVTGLALMKARNRT